MANPKKLSLLELFDEFIRLRVSGTNRDDAWYKVLEIADHLPESDIKKLLNVAKDWERREGYQYHYRSAKSITDTQGYSREEYQAAKEAAAKEESVIKPIKPRPQQPPVQPQVQPVASQPIAAQAVAPVAQRPPNQGLTGQLNPAALRSMEQKKLEQFLEEAFLEEEEAGASAQKLGRTAPIAPVTDERSSNNPAYFGENSILLLYFKGFKEPLQVKVAAGQEMIIGRTTPNSSMSPDIDLAAVQAGDYGVSRMHAAIMQQDDKLLITDLGSINQTFINRQQLHTQEVRVLQDYDEIWFAHLTCKVRFWHPDK